MKSIVIVGVGALGSHLVQLLRNVEANIKVIDLDRVEQKNVQSQFHPKGSVGKPKVMAIAQTMDFLYGVKLTTNGNKLVENNSEALLGFPDLVVDCLDNAAARTVVQDYARRKSIPCLHGALSADGTFGRIIWDELFMIDKEAKEGAATCEDGDHLPFISIASSYLAQATKDFLTKGTRLNVNVTPSGAFRI